MRIAFVLAAALAMASASAAEPSHSLDPRQFTQWQMRVAIEAKALEWLRANAQAFDMDALGAQPLSPLVDALEGARVVGVGEVTHGTHEDSAFKVALMEAMIARGDRDLVFFELNRATGERLDAFIAPGSAETDAAAAMLDAHVYGVWMTTDMAGFLAWLQAWNRSAAKPVHVVGVDVQDAAGDFTLALDALAASDAAHADALRLRLDAFLSEKGRAVHMGQVIAAMTHLQWQQAMAAARELEAALGARPNGDAALARARSAASAAIAGLRTFESDSTGAEPSADNPRDRAMADRLLERLSKGQRALFWAHDGHVLRGEYTPGFSAATVGTRLNEVLGRQDYEALNFSYARAALLAIDVTGTGAVSGRDGRREAWNIGAQPGSLGAFAAQAGPKNFWVDLRRLPAGEEWPLGWLSLPYERLMFGWGISADMFSPYYFPDPIRYGFDILVHIDTLTPSPRVNPRRKEPPPAAATSAHPSPAGD